MRGNGKKKKKALYRDAGGSRFIDLIFPLGTVEREFPIRISHSAPFHAQLTKDSSNDSVTPRGAGLLEAVQATQAQRKRREASEGEDGQRGPLLALRGSSPRITTEGSLRRLDLSHKSVRITKSNNEKLLYLLLYSSSKRSPFSSFLILANRFSKHFFPSFGCGDYLKSPKQIQRFLILETENAVREAILLTLDVTNSSATYA